MESNNIIKGNVKTTIYDGSVKIREFTDHNTGTIDICKYIRLGLMGKSYLAERPGILRAYTKDSTTGNFVPLTASGVAVQEIKEGSVGDTSCSCIYSFIIPSSHLSQGTVIYKYELCSLADISKVYATIVFNESDSITIASSNINVKVDWTLSISYK